MASLVSIGDYIYETVSREAREKGKSYDEAVKRYLECCEEILIGHKKELLAWFVANRPETAEYLEKCYNQVIESYLNAKEKYETEPKKLLDWIAAKAGIHVEDKKKLEYTV